MSKKEEIKSKVRSFSPTFIFCTRVASTVKVGAGGWPAGGGKEGRKQKRKEIGEEEEEEDEEDSPVECSGGETKQLAFIPGEVSGPIPFS